MSRSLRRDERPGLYCIELRTQNWAALVEWYREVLGLRILVRVVDDGYALIEAGETRLALISRRSTGEPSRRISLAFEVSDLWPICQRLAANGVLIGQGKPSPEGLQEINIADPDGNRIRLFSWPQGR